MITETIAKALGGRKVGAAWMARCPVHDDRKPSLSIRDADNKILVRCHAGCEQREVISALWKRGLWAVCTRRLSRRVFPRSIAKHQPDVEDGTRSSAALTIWRSSAPAAGTPVETYLAARGLKLPPGPSLRFHAGLRHPSGGVWPAMVALVSRGTDDTPLAIHRTYLARDGSGKAPIDPSRLMLGPCRGGAVRLAEPDDVLMVGEGIETCLTALQATGRPVWAALSTSGLRALDLPRTIREVIVLADSDKPGEAAARACALRWARESRRVRIARPPRGMDFNDMLMSSEPHNEEGAP